MNTIIELKDISRVYTNNCQSRIVLKNIKLNISAGEMVAIIGPSGSGKSTLLNIIGFIDTPDSGDYYIYGQNSVKLLPDELAKLRREHVGFIFQRYNLLPSLNAVSNVEIPAIYSSRERSLRRSKAVELLALLGLKGYENYKPGELSGGQQQRVSIARALINGGEIILADEPTGALDTRSGQEVLKILCELNKLGHTVIIVTHDMKVAEHAQRIIELIDGKIVADSGSKVMTTQSRRSSICSSIKQKRWQCLFDRTRESLVMAIKTMNEHRLRTILTMTGIVFGIAAVVTVAALGEGAKRRTLHDLKGLETNMVNIYPGRDFSDNGINSIHYLKLSDVHTLAEQKYIDSVSPEIYTSSSITFRGKSVDSSITGVGQDYFRVKGISIIQGNIFRTEPNSQQEAIIDENTKEYLFSNMNIDPIGQIILIGSTPARIIGIAKNNSKTSNKINVWMPYNTVIYRMMGNVKPSSISVRLKDFVNSDTSLNAISLLLTRLHGQQDFRLYNNSQLRRSIENTSTTLSLLIMMIASISLLIGSLGVMNIMLVSVSERTREIGIRIAIGARRSDIMQQFIIEAILMCLIGGVLGVILSFSSGPIITALSGNVFSAIYSMQITITAFFCSTLVGLIFGYIPAHKAARMNPVNSLASE